MDIGAVVAADERFVFLFRRWDRSNYQTCQIMLVSRWIPQFVGQWLVSEYSTMDRPKTFVGNRLNFFTPIYCFLLVSIRRPFYPSRRHDSSACGTGPSDRPEKDGGGGIDVVQISLVPPWGSRVGAPDGDPWWRILLIIKSDDRGDLVPTKRFCGFDSRLVLGPVIPKTLNMGVVPACLILMMKWGPQTITGRPGISIMGLGRLACGPMTCYPNEAALWRGHWVPLLQIGTSSHKFDHPRLKSQNMFSI